MKGFLRVYFFCLLIVSCASKKEIQINNPDLLTVHFIDDFQNNVISMYVNGNKVLVDEIFRLSNTPQLRNVRSKYVSIEKYKAKVYNKGQLNKVITFDQTNEGSIIKIELEVDGESFKEEIDLTDGSYLFVFYENGNILMKQSLSYLE